MCLKRARQPAAGSAGSADHLPLPVDDLRELERFCRPDTDRYTGLTESLRRRKIPFETIPIDGARHITLSTASSGSMDNEYYRVTLVAHYDRVDGTPGANDNAAAVFQLLAHWEKIQTLGWNHRTQILFTDREELTGSMGITDQGAWMLARHLRRLGVDNVLFFVLDMCGIGAAPVWGRSPQKVGLSFPDDSALRAYTFMTKFLKRYTGGEDYGINALFSDDLGLLLGGYPALQLSVLPRSEMEVIQRHGSGGSVNPPGEGRLNEPAMLPPSWSAMHGPDDNVSSLQAAAFNLVARILTGLTRYRFPLGS